MESLKIGQKAPDFEAQTLDGDYISQVSLEGRYVLLEFWATWCGPCIPEIPHLKSLHKKYHQDNFQIIGISLDQDKETLINFIDDSEMEYKNTGKQYHSDILRKLLHNTIKEIAFTPGLGSVTC